MPRVAKYPKQVSALLTEEDGNRLARIVEDNPIGMGELVRELIHDALPRIEKKYVKREGSQMANSA